MSAPPPVPQPLTPPPVTPAPVTPPPPLSAPAPASAAPHNRPVSPPPPPPPGITPIAEPRAPLPTRTRRQANDQVRVPLPRPTLEGSPPGSRANWPTSAAGDDWASPPPSSGGREPYANGATPTSVTPPWRADDLKPPEPPALRLVEPTLPEELRDDLGFPPRSDSRPLRLVEPSRNGVPRSAPPVSADDDNTLLIFEQTRSAWFSQDDEASWGSAMDLGWQAAEQAARPTVGDRTDAGLPRRVPHANLVPGAPPRRDDRPLRVVRDPASIAEHTSGYFSGWRRGQEVGGYPLGGSQRRPSAGAWEFHRDEDRLSG